MTCRRSRAILTVAALFLMVGTALTQPPSSPYTTPGTPWLPPAAPVMPQTYYAAPGLQPPPAATSSWILSVVDEGGTKLQVQTGDGMRATCEHLTIHVNGVEPVQVSLVEKQIQIRCGKEGKAGDGTDAIQASAERVTRSGPDGALLTLEGNAKLRCVRKGKRAEMSAERIAINVATGHIESEMGEQPAIQPIVPLGPSCPITPCSPAGGWRSRLKQKNQDGEQGWGFWVNAVLKAVETAAREQKLRDRSVYSFYMGFMR